MSYDVRFKVKVEGVDEYVSLDYCLANITWNVKQMIMEATGLEWRNCENNGFVKDIIPFIKKGYKELTMHPEKYKQYEATNGWGKVETTAEFFKDLIVAWEQLCEWRKELAEVATFWIE